jgi:hypothetical protein
VPPDHQEEAGPMSGRSRQRTLMNPTLTVTTRLDRRRLEALRLEIRQTARRLGVSVREIRVRYPRP